MKRISFLIAFFACLVANAEPGDKMFVSVENAPLREKKSSLSSVLSECSYGDEVVVIREEKFWRYVTRLSGGAVWIPLSALSSEPILSVDSRISNDELKFATKNFSSQEENAYRTSGVANYDAVDEMEKASVSEDELRAFLSDGGLKVE